MAINETHDPNLSSWVESANDPETDFPVQNLPLAVFTHPQRGSARIGAGIGDMVLDLRQVAERGVLPPEPEPGIYSAPDLAPLMRQGPTFMHALRERLMVLLTEPATPEELDVAAPALVPMSECALHLPCRIGDYTDFYASKHHATNVGSMFRPDNPLLPNYKHVPIGYHGRASSIVVSGTPVRRPLGQTKADEAEAPSFGPCRLLDYELEVGFFVGRGNALGEAIAIDRAAEHIFGLCLVNDWSARDLQKWEYQPLGPFLAKNFGTSISPWVVTLEALQPFRVPGPQREEGDPEPLAYLRNGGDWGFDITLEVWIRSAQMREHGVHPVMVSRGSFADMYWTIDQMLTHHASNGCNMQTGDLLASGTVSGRDKSSRGCLLERTWRGAEPIELPSGEQRRFLQDGDEVILRGFCEREGFRRVGFGECRGVVLPAREG